MKMQRLKEELGVYEDARIKGRVGRVFKLSSKRILVFMYLSISIH